MSASETHYDGQFTLSTQLVKPNYFGIPHQKSLETYPVRLMLFIETTNGEISWISSSWNLLFPL